MKTTPVKFSARPRAGVLLLECLVYIGVFSLLLGLGTAAFYYCWDHTRSVIAGANDVEAAVRAGERWRADVREASGPITVQTNADGMVVKIPRRAGEIRYQFTNGEIRRNATGRSSSWLMLSKVKSSVMRRDPRSNIIAWRWEVELLPRPNSPLLPLRFSFAAPPKYQ